MTTTFTTLTCPECGRPSTTAMAEDHCQIRYTCPHCRTKLRPKADDCCVFCSYGTRPCPPEQERAG